MNDESKIKKRFIARLKEVHHQVVAMAVPERESKRAEAALRQRRGNLSNILGAMADGAYVVDRQNDIRYVNPVLEKDFGLVEGRKCYKYFHGREKACPWCKNEKVFAGETVRWEWHFFKTGRTYDVIDTPLVNFDGSTFKLEILRDITERKRAEEKLFEYQEQLRSLASELILAEERERKIVAADLHDQIGQTLALSNMKMGDLLKNAPDGGIARGLEEIKVLLERTLRDVSTLTFNLSPPILYQDGLEAALEWLTGQIERQYGIRCSFRGNREPRPLEEDTIVLLFRSVRELLVNIVRHAEAQRASVAIQQEEGEMRILIKDDGIGFDVAKVEARVGAGGGFGLFSVRERLRQFGGRIKIESLPDSGTRITLAVPIREA